MSSFSSYLFLDFDLLGACSGSMGTDLVCGRGWCIISLGPFLGSRVQEMSASS